MGNCVSEPTAPVQPQTGEFQSILRLLKGVQIFVGIDCSGSMGGHCGIEGDYRTRSRLVHDLIEPFMRQLMDIDTDGIDTIFYGSTLELYKTNSNNFQNMIHMCERNMGGTDTAAVFRMMFDIHRASNSAKTIGIVITDGSPNSEADCFAVIDQISRSVKSTTEFTILVLRVGEDYGAKEFLEHLDNFRTDGDNVFDVVDTGRFVDVFATPISVYKTLAKSKFD